MPMNEFENFNDKQKEDFARVINTLLFQNYLVERVYNTSKEKYETDSEYRFLDSNRRLVGEYLEMMGWKLFEDDMNGVYSVRNESLQKIKKLTRLETLLLLLLRLIYDEKQSRASLSRDIEVKLSEILNKFEVFKLLEKNLTDTEIKTSMKFLKRYKIIEKKNGEYTNPDTTFVIYPSIIHAFKNENLEEIIKTYQPNGRKKAPHYKENDDEDMDDSSEEDNE